MLASVHRRPPRGPTAANRIPVLSLVLALVLCLSTLVSAAPSTLPYVPTTILVPRGAVFPPQDAARVAYILTPRGDSVDLLALNLTSNFHASSVRTATLTAGLPFVDAASRTAAFAPSLLADGSIAVHAGDCSSPDDHAVWIYAAPNSSPAAAGSWTKHDVNGGGGGGGATGPLFLGGSVSFSSQLAPTVSPSSVYTYGGMCPWSNQTAATWQAAASYTNLIRKISPAAAGGAFIIGDLPSRGPPIAEAGFTFTALMPSVSNRSGTVTQQVNHVLLGGHTQHAFINMSMAAVWSLPEESWSFVPVQGPGAANTELAIRKGIETRALATSVSSRSGHTAVLNHDGSALVVLGGWVGDVSQAADPQLAVLEMGAGYGQWEWSIPTAQPPGQGFYGHGAALLPGNVMMVYGGYAVSPAASRLKSRQAGAANGAPMFLNLTTLTWTDTYTNPGFVGQTVETDTAPSSPSRNIGLGVGLGVGIPLLIAVVAFGLYWHRRRKSHQRNRDETVNSLVQDNSRFLPDEDEMLEREDAPFHFGGAWGPKTAHSWYTGGHDPYGPAEKRRSLGFESLRGSRSNPNMYAPSGSNPRISGVLRNNPSRQNARGLYQPTTLADYESRAGQRGTGGIHPIYEADEDGEGNGHSGGGGEDSSRSVSPDKDDEPASNASDPFLTPTGTRTSHHFPSAPGSHTPSPEGHRQDREVQDWVSDVDTADAFLSARAGGPSGGGGGLTASHSGRGPGRVSPTRRASTRSKGSSPTTASSFGAADDEARTVSNLSDRSAFSFAASTHSASVRSRAGAANRGAHADPAAPPPRSAGAASDGAATAASTSSGAHSFNTARSSFPALQAEGPSLLMLRRQRRGGGGGRGGEGDSPDPPSAADEAEDPGSPSKTRDKNRRSWLGSFRRVFSAGTAPSDSSPASSSRGESPVRRNSSSCEGDYEPRLFGLKGVPNATLLRRQRGKEDWDGPLTPGAAGATHFSPEARGAGGPAGRTSDEWDVEGAGDARMVQIMFTVPRDRLRVVNAEVEREEEEAEIVDPDDHDDDHDDHGSAAAGHGPADTEAAVRPLAAAVRAGDASRLHAAVGDFMRLHRAPTPPPFLGGHGDDGYEDGDDGAWDEERTTLLGGEDGRRGGGGIGGDRTPSPAGSGGGALKDGAADPPLLTAQTVRFRRSQTKVLEMAERYDGLSRHGTPVGTPGGTPVRGEGLGGSV